MWERWKAATCVTTRVMATAVSPGHGRLRRIQRVGGRPSGGAWHHARARRGAARQASTSRDDVRACRGLPRRAAPRSAAPAGLEACRRRSAACASGSRTQPRLRHMPQIMDLKQLSPFFVGQRACARLIAPQWNTEVTKQNPGLRTLEGAALPRRFGVGPRARARLFRVFPVFS